jgi:hypothetical protein
MSEVTSPKARIVWGHPFKSKPVLDDRTKQPKHRNDGTPRRAIEFGIAVPKAEFNEIWQAMNVAVAEKFPTGVPANFAWKFKDGDTALDAKGQPLNTREGYAGNVILTCRTELDSVPNYVFDHTAGRWTTTDTIKRGDYVKVTLDFAARVATSHTEKSSIYVNPKAVMLWEVGAEIKGGEFDPNAAGFAPPPPQQPPAGVMPGAPTPGAPASYAPAAPQQPYAPQAPAYAPQQPAAPAYQPPAPAAPAPTAAPHMAFLKGPGQ